MTERSVPADQQIELEPSPITLELYDYKHIPTEGGYLSFSPDSQKIQAALNMTVGNHMTPGSPRKLGIYFGARPHADVMREVYKGRIDLGKNADILIAELFDDFPIVGGVMTPDATYPIVNLLTPNIYRSVQGVSREETLVEIDKCTESILSHELTHFAQSLRDSTLPWKNTIELYGPGLVGLVGGPCVTFKVLKLLMEELDARILGSKLTRRTLLKKAVLIGAGIISAALALPEGVIAADHAYWVTNPYENEARANGENGSLRKELSGAFHCAWE
jgi:hypothetical protein